MRRVVLVTVLALLIVAGDGVGQRLSSGAGAALSEGPAAPGAAPAPTTTSTSADPRAFASVLEASGVTIEDGVNIYAALVHNGKGGIGYETYEAGGGGTAEDFWPASSVKPLAAAGALEFLGTLGFTGDASVTFADGDGPWLVRDLYDAAIVDSSNDAYDRLVEIAGVDWLNTVFLTPERGFPETVIQRSYVDGGAIVSPDMTVTDGDRTVDVPERDPQGDYGVPDVGNRSNLRELADSVSRIVLHDQLPADRRFHIAQADADALSQALATADGFMAPGVTAALGTGATVYSKPGYVVGDDCVDVIFVRSPAFPSGAILAASVRDDSDECATLSGIAEAAMNFLKAKP